MIVEIKCKGRSSAQAGLMFGGGDEACTTYGSAQQSSANTLVD